MAQLLSDALVGFFYAKDLTPKSVSWYEENLTKFFLWLPTPTTASLTPENVRQYITAQRASGKYSTYTVHGYMRAIKAFLNHLKREGQLDWDVSRLEMPRRVKAVVEVFTTDELNVLFAAAARTGLRESALLWVLLDTGIRAIELCTLTRDRVHFYKDDAYLVVQGKGRKVREVGLGRKARSALHKYVLSRQDDNPVLFLSKRHAALTVVGLDKLLCRLRDEAGLPITLRVSAHKWRHTYALNFMAQPDANVYRLSKLMGHTSVVTTESYLQAFNQRDARRGFSVGDRVRS